MYMYIVTCQSCYEWSQNVQQSIDGGSDLLQLFFEILFGNSSVINSESQSKTGLASSDSEVSKSMDGVVLS